MFVLVWTTILSVYLLPLFSFSDELEKHYKRAAKTVTGKSNNARPNTSHSKTVPRLFNPKPYELCASLSSGFRVPTFPQHAFDDSGVTGCDQERYVTSQNTRYPPVRSPTSLYNYLHMKPYQWSVIPRTISSSKSTTITPVSERWK